MSNQNWRQAATSEIETLRRKLDEMNRIRESPRLYLSEYISKEINRVDIQRENESIKAFKYYQTLIDKLESFEKECQTDIDELQFPDIEKIQEEIDGCQVHLENGEIDEDGWRRIVQKNDIENILDEIKESLLKYNTCRFRPDQVVLLDNRQFVGDLLIRCKHFAASTILNSSQSQTLMELCQFPDSDQFELIYQASRDGWKAEGFHTKCDGIKDTLTVFRTVGGGSFIFGGFASVVWDTMSSFKKDPCAFVFSLTNKDKQPMKLNCSNQERALFCSSHLFPSFGYDIIIQGDSNRNFESYSNLGSSYGAERFDHYSREAITFLSGCAQIQLDEIELFAKISN